MSWTDTLVETRTARAATWTVGDACEHNGGPWRIVAVDNFAQEVCVESAMREPQPAGRWLPVAEIFPLALTRP